MPSYIKKKLWALLGSSAGNFALYCNNKATDNAKIIGYMFENIDELDLGSELMQTFVIPTLLNDGVIDQAVVDRINEEVGS